VGIDDFLKAMQEDELQDELEEQTNARINDYARTRGIKPQLVHYHVRAGHLKKIKCACGALVVNIEAADAALGIKKATSETDIERRHSDEDTDEEDEADTS
jgi:hypothetical protein